MTTSHAPGPWSIGPDHTIYDATGGPIAQVSRACCESAEEAQATARLIAAAPDLLEVVNAILRAPSIGSSGPGSSTIVVQDYHLRAARAAVAKAEEGR